MRRRAAVPCGRVGLLVLLVLALPLADHAHAQPTATPGPSAAEGRPAQPATAPEAGPPTELPPAPALPDTLGLDPPGMRSAPQPDRASPAAIALATVLVIAAAAAFWRYGRPVL